MPDSQSGICRALGAIDDTQNLAHYFGLARKQKPEWTQHTEYPLTYRLIRVQKCPFMGAAEISAMQAVVVKEIRRLAMLGNIIRRGAQDATYSKYQWLQAGVLNSAAAALSRLAAPRLFQHAKPFEQAVFVPINPTLDDLTIFETVDRNARPSDCFA